MRFFVVLCYALNMNNDIEQLAKIQPQEAFFGMGRFIPAAGNNTPIKVYDSGVRSKGAWSVGFPSDFVVVGYNPENADMSNPNGAIIRERFYIVAEDAKGNRRTWGGLYESEATAEAAYALFAPPVEFWEETRPCYGSEAWTAEVEAAEAEAERADEMASEFSVRVLTTCRSADTGLLLHRRLPSLRQDWRTGHLCGRTSERLAPQQPDSFREANRK